VAPELDDVGNSIEEFHDSPATICKTPSRNIADKGEYEERYARQYLAAYRLYSFPHQNRFQRVKNKPGHKMVKFVL
jgi:hypothetical protein